MATPKHDPIKELRYKVMIDIDMAYEDADNPDVIAPKDLYRDLRSLLDQYSFNSAVTIFNLGDNHGV